MTVAAALDLAPRLATAVDLARQAGALLLDYQSRRLTIRTKTSDTDPVSEADHASEVLVMEGLAAAFPDDGRLGEEAESNSDGTSGYRWVVDPLDGTVNYLYGLQAWCVSIGLEDEHGEPVLGVVHHPLGHETFVAVRGGGARRLTADDPGSLDAGTPLHASTQTDPALSLVATGYHYLPEVRHDQSDRIAGLVRSIRDVRRGGAAALDLAWTAAGRLDGYGEHGLGPWDWTAGVLLVTEAGGSVVLRRDTLGGHVLQGVFAGTRPIVDLLTGLFD